MGMVKVDDEGDYFFEVGEKATLGFVGQEIGYHIRLTRCSMMKTSIALDAVSTACRRGVVYHQIVFRISLHAPPSNSNKSTTDLKLHGHFYLFDESMLLTDTPAKVGTLATGLFYTVNSPNKTGRA